MRLKIASMGAPVLRIHSNPLSIDQHSVWTAITRLTVRFDATQKTRAPNLLLWMLLSFATLGAIAGCGTGGYFSQSEQTNTITVSETSGNLSHSTTLTRTVEEQSDGNEMVLLITVLLSLVGSTLAQSLRTPLMSL